MAHGLMPPLAAFLHPDGFTLAADALMQRGARSALIKGHHKG